MINRTIALILFFMVSVVLYYENANLKNEIKELKKNLEIKNKKNSEHSEIANVKSFKNTKLEQEYLSKLQECEEKFKKQAIVQMVPIIPQSKIQKTYTYDDDNKLEFMKPYKNDKNETKKQKFLLTPDFGYDKITQDLKMRVEIKKEF